MARLPRGFAKGLMVGGVVAVLWGVLGNRHRRATVAWPLVEKAEAVPFLGPRLYSFFAGELMEGVYRAVAEDVVAEVGVGELLELGAGPGFLAAEIGTRNRDVEVTALNSTGGMVQAAEARVHHAGVGRQVKVVRGDATDIPFPNDAFDCVISLGGLQHWSAPELALAEIYRVLRPGGKVLLYNLRREVPTEGWDRVREETPLLLRPVFDVTVAIPAERALTEGQISSLVTRTPFWRPETSALSADIAGVNLPAITKVTLQK
jgi:SAM-dependent methyltransferase